MSQTLWRVLHTPLVVNALYLAARSGVDAALGMSFWVLAARLYSAEEVGLAAATIAAMGLLATIAPLGLEASLIRFLPRAQKHRGAEQINLALVLAGAVAVISAAVFLLGVGVWAPPLDYLRDNPFYFIAFALFVAAWSLLTLLIGVYVGARRAGHALAQGTTFSVVRILTLASLALLLPGRGIVLAWSIGLVAAVCISLFVLMPRVRPGHRFSLRFSRTVAGEMLSFSLPNHVANMAWQAPTWILPLLVLSLRGAEENAYFYVAWTLAWSLGALPTAVSLSLTAEGAADESRLVHNLRQAIRGLLLLLLPAVIILLLAAKQILGIFGAEYAENAAPTLRLLVLAVIPSSVSYLYTAVRRVEKKLTGIVGLTVFVALTTIVGSYLLIDRVGLVGIAYAWLGAQSAGALFAGWHLWRKLAGSDQTKPVNLPSEVRLESRHVARARPPSLLPSPSRSTLGTRDD